MLIKSNQDIESNNSFTSNSLQISFTRIRSLYCWSIFFRFLMYSGSVPSSSCCNCFFKWANLSWYILQEVLHFTKFKNSIQFSSHAALNCINWNLILFSILFVFLQMWSPSFFIPYLGFKEGTKTAHVPVLFCNSYPEWISWVLLTALWFPCILFHA